jgi:hypothetical protein
MWLCKRIAVFDPIALQAGRIYCRAAKSFYTGGGSRAFLFAAEIAKITTAELLMASGIRDLTCTAVNFRRAAASLASGHDRMSQAVPILSAGLLRAPDESVFSGAFSRFQPSAERFSVEIALASL